MAPAAIRSRLSPRPVIATTLLAAVGLAVGTRIAQEAPAFELLAAAVASVVAPLAAARSNLLVALFLSVLWARVSDVGIAEHASPSLAVPFGVGLICLALRQRFAAGERIGAGTFRQLVPVLPYLIVVSLSALWAAAPSRTLGVAADLAKDLLIFWVLLEWIADLRTLKTCCVALTCVAGALGALSIYQAITTTFTSDYGGFAQAQVRQIVGSTSSYRLSGPVGDPNYYALILLVVAPVGLALLRTRLHPLAAALIGAATVLASGAVLLTYSRGGAVVLALGVALSLARLRLRAPLLATAILAVPLAIMLVPGPVWTRLGTLLEPFEDSGRTGQVVDDSVELRLGAQRVALEMFLDHPLGGVGAGNYPLLYQEYSRNLGVPAVAAEFYPHNLYLEVAAETGVLGVLAFLPVVVGPLLALEHLRRTTRADLGPARDWPAVAGGVEIALVCYLLASVMLHASYPRYLWMLLALAVATRRLAPTPRRWSQTWPT